MSYKNGENKVSKLVWFDRKDFEKLEEKAKENNISLCRYILQKLDCYHGKDIQLGEEWINPHKRKYNKKKAIGEQISEQITYNETKRSGYDDPYRV
jgi:hypothetical protein